MMTGTKADAKFSYYEEFPHTRRAPLAMFEILNEAHRSYGLKCSAGYLRYEGLTVPEHLAYTEWKQQEEKK